MSVVLGLAVTGIAEESTTFKELKEQAEQGDAYAQYNLGLCYDEGKGVPQDYVETYAWSLHATLNGNSKLKDLLVEKLTPEQIAAGQVRAKELQQKLEK